MPLDMFQQSQADTNAYVQRNNAPRLPATFGDAFEAAWNENRLFGQSLAGVNARHAAIGDYLDELKRKTGEDVEMPADFPMPSLDAINDKVAKLKAANPDLNIDPLTDEEVDRRAVE